MRARWLSGQPTHTPAHAEISTCMHEARSHHISSGLIFMCNEPVVVLFRLSERTVNTLQYVGSKREGVIFLYRWF